MMIRIGEFARMGGVTPATLRLYDEQGLLEPASVDPGSGYRAYYAEQLRQLQQVTMLKSLGFTLREIKAIQEGAHDADALTEQLAAKLREVEAQLQIERQKMKRLELQIQIIKGLQTMNTSDITIINVPVITAIATRLTIPTNDLAGPMLGEAFDNLYGDLRKHTIEPAGPCLCIWHSGPDTVTGEVVDAVVPIRSESKLPEGLLPETCPGGLHATVTHRGPFEEFQTCHIILKEWLAANAYQLSGPYREVYHTPPGPESVTEVQYPIAKL